MDPLPGTNALSQGRVGAISHPPSTNTSHLYRVVALPGTNMIKFVPALVVARYKCATTIFPSFPARAPPPPPHFSSSSLQLELPLPNGALGSFCPIYDNFSLI
jgi:hypothetical protein